MHKPCVESCGAIPHIAGYCINKLFNRVTTKCQACENKVSHEHGDRLNLSHNSRITYNTSHIDMRYEGGLM